MKLLMALLLFFVLQTSHGANTKVYTFAIIGDAGEWNTASQSVRDSIAKSKIPGLILPGDNLYDMDRSYEEVWSHWPKPFRFDLVAIGNHTAGYAEEIAFFKMPGEFYTQTLNGKARFIVLNSDNEKTATTQAAFLEKVLSIAKEPQIFIMYHHPSYKIGKHDPSERKKFQSQILPVIWKYRSKITALINGHDHQASFITLNDLPLIVSGAVHEARDAPKFDYIAPDDVRVKSQWMYRGDFYWVRLDINTELNETWINYVNATHETVECSVKIDSQKNYEMNDNCKRTNAGGPVIIRKRR